MKGLQSLLDFMDAHPDETACRQKLRELRWGTNGFRCPRCHETERWGYIQTRELYQCKNCRYQCSVTAGTILQDTKLGVRQWFLALWLVVTTKKGVAGIDLARKLGVHEETGHFVLQKIQRLLRRGKTRQLTGLVEVDETYVGGKRPGESGRGTSKTQVVVMIENRNDKAGQARLEVVPDASGGTLARVVQHHVAKGSVLRTDGWIGYAGLQGYILDPHQQATPQDGSRILPWAHTIASNLKRVVYGVHSYVSGPNTRPYLDAFEFRLNYRSDLGTGVRRALHRLAEHPPTPNRFLRVKPASC